MEKNGKGKRIQKGKGRGWEKKRIGGERERKGKEKGVGRGRG